MPIPHSKEPLWEYCHAPEGYPSRWSVEQVSSGNVPKLFAGQQFSILLRQNISHRNWFHRYMGPSSRPRSINGPADSAGLFFPKAAQALSVGARLSRSSVPIRRPVEELRERLGFPVNGIRSRDRCILEQPPQILTVACGPQHVPGTASGLQNLLVARFWLSSASHIASGSLALAR